MVVCNVVLKNRNAATLHVSLPANGSDTTDLGTREVAGVRLPLSQHGMVNDMKYLVGGAGASKLSVLNRWSPSYTSHTH